MSFGLTGRRGEIGLGAGGKRCQRNWSKGVQAIELGSRRIFPAEGLFLIAGPCVIEEEGVTLETAAAIKVIAEAAGMEFIFKSSFDKANRSSVTSFRGPGLARGLEILARVREEVGVPVVTDVHERTQVKAVSEAVDVIQIPAFLCRQTDLLTAAGESGKVVNVKKGQFLSPWDMANVVEKVASTGNTRVMITERGTSFGYNNLVVDFRSIPIMKEFGFPVLIDASHSVQKPGGEGFFSGGDAEFIPTIAKAGVSSGADGVFIELHDSPKDAKSDSRNSLILNELTGLLPVLKRLREVVQG